MSLKIRLSRGGAKKRPFYRIVVTDSRNPRGGLVRIKGGARRDDPFYNPFDYV